MSSQTRVCPNCNFVFDVDTKASWTATEGLKEKNDKMLESLKKPSRFAVPLNDLKFSKVK